MFQCKKDKDVLHFVVHGLLPGCWQLYRRSHGECLHIKCSVELWCIEFYMRKRQPVRDVILSFDQWVVLQLLNEICGDPTLSLFPSLTHTNARTFLNLWVIGIDGSSSHSALVCFFNIIPPNTVWRQPSGQIYICVSGCGQYQDIT